MPPSPIYSHSRYHTNPLKPLLCYATLQRIYFPHNFRLSLLNNARYLSHPAPPRYVGEGARMVRELFEMARTKKACIIFFDEIDAIGGARVDDGAGGDNEVQRTMLELINQLDGFDPRGNIKVLMATNRPDTLDPALLRPGRLDRKIEFGLPDLEGRAHILKIHARSMSVERDIRYELIARLCPNTTGAELRSVCTEAGMYAIRARRKVATEKDFLESVNKVVKGYAKFSSTPKYVFYSFCFDFGVGVYLSDNPWGYKTNGYFLGT